MKFNITALATVATIAFGTAASASSVYFGVDKGWSTSGHTYGPVTVYGATVDTDGKILTNDEKVASWSGHGLGVCDKSNCTGYSSEDSWWDQHTIDGKNDAGMALLDFGSMNVEITSVTFSHWEHDDDFDYAVFSSLAVGSSPLVWDEDVQISGSGSYRTFTFAQGTLVGSLFGFGADYRDDEFKLKALTYETVPTNEVPLPAGFFLMGTALGAAGLLRRRKKA
ncbi:MAG: VPLPA-CTERM sorting domain-containing protein [Pseudooceanicola sp.]